MQLIKFFLNPFNILWLLLLVTIATWYVKKDRLYKISGLVFVGWFLLISTPLLPNIVLNSLEDKFEPIQIEKLANRDLEYHIIVLGGGHGFDDRLPANSLLSSNALGRLNEGLRLHRRLTNSKMVFSGSTSTPGRTTQAEMLQKTAFLLGVEERATMLQKEPSNTYEEAKVYASKYGISHPLIVVASAAQMPRAVEVFKKFGINPIASPTNYRLKGSWKNKWLGLPSLENIENLKIGMYEYTGIWWYRIRCRLFLLC